MRRKNTSSRYRKAKQVAQNLAVCAGIVVCFAVTVVFASLLTTDPQKAESLLLGQGYTDVKITGYRWLGCADSEAVKTGFIATDLRGNRIEGVVCSQLFFKGSTIRFD